LSGCSESQDYWGREWWDSSPGESSNAKFSSWEEKSSEDSIAVAGPSLSLEQNLEGFGSQQQQQQQAHVTSDAVYSDIGPSLSSVDLDVSGAWDATHASEWCVVPYPDQSQSECSATQQAGAYESHGVEIAKNAAINSNDSSPSATHSIKTCQDLTVAEQLWFCDADGCGKEFSRRCELKYEHHDRD
jgi:hypothetical protein